MKDFIFPLSACAFLLIIFPAFGQNASSGTMDDLIGIPLKSAHEKLLDSGFEIAQSSLFHKKQLWYNESKGECLTFEFEKNDENTVIATSPGKEKKCISGVKRSREVWANYRDGEASDSSPDIDRERDLLRQQGYSVSYWVHNVAPGKTMEVWYNEAGQLSKSISWDNATKSNIKVLDRDPRLGTNPAPIYGNLQ